MHHELCAVYGLNIMSEGVVYQWVRFFLNGRTNIHNEESSSRPSLVNDDLLNKVNEEVCENHHFTILELSNHFPEISEFFTRDSDRKTRLNVLCSLGTENAYWQSQNKRNVFCCRLSFPVSPWRRRIFVQDCYRQWDLGCLCESWDKTTVNTSGTYCFSKKTKEYPSNFVSKA